jgi:hypothetical protein
MVRISSVYGRSVAKLVEIPESPARRGSRGQGDLDHSVALVAEHLVGLLDLLEAEAMGDQRPEVKAAVTTAPGGVWRRSNQRRSSSAPQTMKG